MQCVNRVLALMVLVYGCGGGSTGGGNDSDAVSMITSVSVFCTPTRLEKSGSANCTATVRGNGTFDQSVEWSADGGVIDSMGSFTAPDRAETITITATSVSNSNASGSTTVVVSAARAAVDLADDESGYHVHVMYVVPSDGEDRGLDIDGTIALSVESWNEWFAARTGGRRLRLDRHNGALDITFARLHRSNAEMNVFGAEIRGQIEAELIVKGFDAPDKVYLVYYDGGDAQTETCGNGAYPPSVPGIVGALYLTAIPAVGRPCIENPFATTASSPGYVEFSGIHEVLHVLGFVPACAPNHTRAGHVSDANSDLMYAGPLAWNPFEVDFNGDDYLDVNLQACLDLADSAFLDPLPALAQPPPGWPYERLTSIPCDHESSLQSTAGNATNIQFVNGTLAPIVVHWLDFSGTRQLRRVLQPFEGYISSTFTTHPFVVTDETNQCLEIFLGASKMGRAIVGYL